MIKRLEPDPDLDQLVRKLNEEARVVEGDSASVADDSPPPPAAVGAGPALPSTVVRGFVLPPARSDGDLWLVHLLARARKLGASDLLLVVGAPPAARVNGRLTRLGDKPLGEDAAGLLCAALVPDERRAGLERSGSSDFSFRRDDLGRYRCNVHRQRGHWSASIRLFPDAIPKLDALNLPPTLERFSELEYALRRDRKRLELTKSSQYIYLAK